jgi:hypothetical protein
MGKSQAKGSRRIAWYFIYNLYLRKIRALKRDKLILGRTWTCFKF